MSKVKVYRLQDTSDRRHVGMTPEFAEAIESYRSREGLPDASAAVRQLVEFGLAALAAPASEAPTR
jgi:hypothetical protein